jgi:hypothetical protein
MQRSLTQLGHTSVLALVAAAGVALSAAPTIAQPHALVAAIALGQTAETPPKVWNLPKRSTLALVAPLLFLLCAAAIVALWLTIT